MSSLFNSSIIRSLVPVFVLTATTLSAEILSVGVKGGIPVTDVVEGSSTAHSEAPRYTVGPMVNISLPFSFAVEVDALYKRTGYSVTNSGFNVSSFTRVRANSWEFPILLKYYLPGYHLPVRPFAEVGYVVRHISGLNQTTSILSGPGGSGLSGRGVLRDDPTSGVALGGGLELKAARLRIAPEFRYTHWAGRPFETFGARGFSVRSVDNQAEFLLGVRF